jgi:multiple sugar transport system ATP-binding protein
MADVELRQVTKRYPPDVLAVNAVDVHIRDRERVALVGPSGCGKTTLLRLIAGLESLTSGAVTIGGTCMNDRPPWERDLAMVFQNYALYPHLTVRENLAFGLKMRKTARSIVTQRVQEAAQCLDIEALLDRKPGTLSGGQRQRVALGRALAKNPKVLLLDEPLSHLDARLRVQMRSEIARLHARRESTLIYVTHDQVEAMTLGDRLVVLRNGTIQQIGTPLEVYEAPRNRFVAEFIGSPAMNFIKGRTGPRCGHRFLHPDFSIKLNGEDATVLGPIDRELYLGIRPEDIILQGNDAPAAPDDGLRALVERIEPLGHERMLYLRAGSQKLTTRTTIERPVKPGDTLNIRFDLGKVHFFDAQTDNAIRGPATAAVEG